MPRTIIKTDTAGWYIDPTANDKKVRKQDGDIIVTRGEYDQMVLDAEDGKGEAPNAVTNGNASEAARKQTVKDAAAAAPVMLTSGRLSKGATATIRCAWVDPDKRTPEQQKLFAKGAKAITYEKVLAAADGKASAKPDGREVVIQVQDAFQVRFHPENQRKHRAELRRIKNKKRRDAARKAAKAA
jgi:hypothetical protein